MSNYTASFFVDREKKYLGFQKLLKPDVRQAIMVIEGQKDMGKTWLINKMALYCQEEVKFPVAQIDFRNPREIHEMQDTLGLIRLLRNKLHSPDHFNHLNAVINQFTEAHRSGSGLGMLRRYIETYFTLDDIKNITFDLQIKYDNLAGETLSAKSRELVNYCHLHNLLEGLVELCVKLRPHVDWKRALGSMAEATASAPIGAETETAVADNNAPIWADSDMERQRALRQINETFFACAAKLMADRGQLVFLFDSYEEAHSEFEIWIKRELLPRLRDGQLNDIVVIITGRKTPDLTDINIKHLLVETQLEAFNEEYVREYFTERRGITDPDIHFPTVLLTSGGVPGALAMMADRIALTTQDDDDFFSDL